MEMRYMDIMIDLLDDPLMTRQIQMGRKKSVE